MAKTTMATLKKAAQKYGIEVEEDKTQTKIEMFAPDGQCWESGELHSLVFFYGSEGSYLPEWRNEAIARALEDVEQYGPMLEVELN